MSMLPYFYDDINVPLRTMERDFFSPDFFSPSRNFFGPSAMPPWSKMVQPWSNVLQPLEHLSEAMNSLAFNEVGKVTADDEKFQVIVDVQHFAPEEIKVKVVDKHVIVEGKHEEKRDHHGYISRQFIRKYALPEGCLPDTVESKLSSDGLLTVTAPKVLAMPSTGEKIVPIKKTGPVKKKIMRPYKSEPLQDAGTSKESASVEKMK